MSKLVLPGDFVTASALSAATNEERIIGTGLEKCRNGVFSMVPGILHECGNKIWVVSATKRYVPRASDRVLGVVTSRAGEYYRVDVGSADLALLNFISFEGATKRNRPNVRIGDLIYGQVILSSKHMEPELSCIDSEGRARGMGIISTPGLIFSVSLNYARRLLLADDTFLALLGKRIRFESTIGMNGKIWITSDNQLAVLAVRDAIIDAEKTFESNRSLLVDRAIHDAQSVSQLSKINEPVKTEIL